MLSAYLAAGACAIQCTGSAKSQHACEGVCHPPAKFGLISWGTLTSYFPFTHPCSRAQLTKCFQHTLLQGHVHQCTGSAKSQHACEGVCHPPAKFGLISWGTLTSYFPFTHPCSRAQLTKCFQHTLLQGHVHSSALAQPSHSMLVRVSATHLPSVGSSAGVPLPHTVP